MRRSRSVALLPLLLGLTSTGVPGSPAVAETARQAGWGPVVNLTRPAPATYGPDLAVGGSGDAVTVWGRGNGNRSHLYSASRRSGGAWTAARRVPGTRGAFDAKVGVDGDGDLVLAWSAGRRVHAVRRAAGGSWAEPTTLHRTPAGVRGTRPAFLDLAVNARGDAVVAWETLDDDEDGTYARSRVQAAVGRPAGGWTRARTLSSPRSHAYRAQTVVDDGGRVTAVWSEDAGRRGRMMTASRDVGAAWDPSRPLSGRLTQAGLPRVAAGPSGELAVAWPVGRARTAGIRLRRWQAGGGWSRAAAVPGVRSDVLWMDLGVDDTGRVTVGWTNRAAAVWAAEQTATGGWTRARVARRGSVYFGMQVVVNPAGDTLIGWDGQGPGDRHAVKAAYRPRAGSWGPAVSLSDTGGDAGGLVLGLATDGEATAAWRFARTFRAPGRIQARQLTLVR